MAGVVGSTSLLLRTARAFCGPQAAAISKLGSATQARNYGTDRSLARYGGRSTVTMLPGAGIGPEMMGHLKEVFRYAGVPVDFEEINVDTSGTDAASMSGAITSIRRNGVAIKGNIESRSNQPGTMSHNVELRNQLDLFAYVLHCRSHPTVPTRHPEIDIVIVRQNTEGEYAMMEHENVPGVIESLKVITLSNCERLARFTFDYALEQGRKKVTAIHKANIMKLSDGLFLETMKRVAKSYPSLEFSGMIVDNCCMQMVSRPEQFDVMVMPNLYGTVVSNVACGLAGGPGIMSGKNYGAKYAVFEPGTRNTGSAMVGKNIANPLAMLNAGCDMLGHLGLHQHEQLIRQAVERAICERITTPDAGGNQTTTNVVQFIIDDIKENTRAARWGHATA
ncbi:isocitrate dehydrogenase [NAD] subunit gamma, mitochondrial-like [Pollicipes pollicipes]|uniref:isocitrate dehydrogenase [NAD] subunit gamma, mitochondrial-like n=1 Tax=Pollicipes pollicipes TaxID=41117 RepID=UPI0018858E10|nr:isocitrate dehydrogenase [NAD] subunit gamma, mitochondrial-like [Pollicipes pollicipes]